MKALENTFYDYDGEEKSSFASSVFSSIIVLLLEKYDLEKNELDYNKI